MGSGTEKQEPFLECHFNHVIEHSPMYLEFKDDSFSFLLSFMGTGVLQRQMREWFGSIWHAQLPENLRSVSLGIDI